jgi:hypothetical protein
VTQTKFYKKHLFEVASLNKLGRFKTEKVSGKSAA